MSLEKLQNDINGIISQYSQENEIVINIETKGHLVILSSDKSAPHITNKYDIEKIDTDGIKAHLFECLTPKDIYMLDWWLKNKDNKEAERCVFTAIYTYSGWKQ